MTHVKTETTKKPMGTGYSNEIGWIAARFDSIETRHTVDIGSIEVVVEHATIYDRRRDEHEQCEYRTRCEINYTNGASDPWHSDEDVSIDVTVEEAKAMIEIMQKFIRISEMQSKAK